MIGNLDPANEHFLNALSQLQRNLQTIQRQLSSGVKIERPSDAPDRLYDVIYRQSEITHSGQMMKNMTRLQASADTADTSLQQAIDIVEQALSAGTQALNVNLDSERGDALAQQVGGLHETLVRLSQASSEGGYVFGGDQDQQTAYRVNTANENGVDRLVQQTSTRQVLDFDGSRFIAGRTAQEIFDHRNADDSLAGDNAFAALNTLRVAIENDDTDAIRASIDKLHAAQSYLNRQLGFYGSLQNRITTSIDQGQKREVQMKSELADIRETDVAAAALQLTQIQTNIEAALRAQGAVTPQPSLFDYLG